MKIPRIRRATKPQWFAAGGGLVRSGPFPNQRAAWESMTLAPDAQARNHGNPYPPDTRVWPEWSTP